MKIAGIITVLCATSLLLAVCNGEDLSPLFTGYEFSQLVFDDVTQQDLIDAALALNESIENPDTGLTGIFAELSRTVSEVCLQDSSTFLRDMLKYKNYALQMRASFAQVPSKVDVGFTHRLKFLGDFELCDAVTAGSIADEPSFDAVPCMMNVLVTYPLSLQYEVGVCVPSSCYEHELSEIVMTDIQQFSKTELVWFQCAYKEPGRWYMWLMVFIIIVLTGFVIWGTVYDYLIHRKTIQVVNNSGTTSNVVMSEMSQPKPANGNEPVTETSNTNLEVHGEAGTIEGAATANPTSADDPRPSHKSEAIQERPQMSKKARILMGFSATTNSSEVMSCKRPPSNLGAINGIRVLSMTWIIWLHTTDFIQIYRFIDNPGYLSEDIKHKLWYNLISRADLGVDTFFVLSGLLVTYLTLKKMKTSNGEMSWFFFYLQRYLRLTPLYVFAIGVYVLLSPLVGRGYQKREGYSEIASSCATYGVTNLLYINNLFPGPYYLSVCMGWSWYLANDMQFYFLSPLFLILLCRPSRAKYGIALTIVVTCLSVIITMGFSYAFHLSAGNYPEGHPDAFGPGYGLIYATPWCRIQSYTVGIFVGYLLYKINGQKKKIPLVWNTVGWVAAMLGVFIPVFAMYFTSYDDPIATWFVGFWLGSKRLMFASGVGWIVYACVTGNGGFIDAFLSWKVWLPLSRLSYAAYLFHPIIMTHWIYTSKTEFHWTAHNAVYMFFSFFVVTYFVSFLSSLLAEIPFVKMTKVLTERPVVKVQRRDVL